MPLALLVRVAAAVAARFDVWSVCAAGQAAKFGLNASIAVIVFLGDISLILKVVVISIGLSLSLSSTVISAIVTIMAPVGGLIVAAITSLTSPYVVIGAEASGLIALVFAIRWPIVRQRFDSANIRDVEQAVLRHHAVHPFASHALSGEQHAIKPADPPHQPFHTHGR